MAHEKIRHQLFLSAALSKRLDALATQRKVPRSALLEQAMTVWLDSQGTNLLEDRFGRRLDLIFAALGRNERNDDILRETLALFIRYQLAIHPPLADDDVAGRAIGRQRFNLFVTRVARRLAAGKKSVGDVIVEGGQ